MAATINAVRSVSTGQAITVVELTADAATATYTLPTPKNGLVGFYWNRTTNACGAITSYDEATGIVTVPSAAGNVIQVFLIPVD